MREKKVIYVKQPSVKKDIRYCLFCGADISHRTRKVQFCCPSCKAMYEEQRVLREQEKMSNPIKRNKTENSQIAKFKRRYGNA